MGLILDASAALAWLVERVNPAEALLADRLLMYLQTGDALVPALWYAEVANGLLVSERRGIADSAQTEMFMGKLNRMRIAEDPKRPADLQAEVLVLARSYGLTGYDATYLELVLRTKWPLATFDRQLAEATRKAGARVFGDPA